MLAGAGDALPPTLHTGLHARLHCATFKPQPATGKRLLGVPTVGLTRFARAQPRFIRDMEHNDKWTQEMYLTAYTQACMCTRMHTTDTSYILHMTAMHRRR